MQGFLLEVIGAISGPLYDRGHFRTLACAGAVLNVAALVAASFATEYYSIFLALGKPALRSVAKSQNPPSTREGVLMQHFQGYASD